MVKKIDFKKYKYYYNGWIARKDRETGKTELFYNGEWTPWKFGMDLDAKTRFDTDLEELNDNAKDRKLLIEEMKFKIEQHRTI